MVTDVGVAAAALGLMGAAAAALAALAVKLKPLDAKPKIDAVQEKAVDVIHRAKKTIFKKPHE